MSCPEIGVGGIHSDSYYDDGECHWCGKQDPRTKTEALSRNRIRWVGVTALIELIAWMGESRSWGKQQWRRNYRRMRRHYRSRIYAVGEVGVIYGAQIIRSGSVADEPRRTPRRGEGET